MTEPTPACVTTTRARRIVSTISSNERKSTSSAPRLLDAAEWPCWTTSSSSSGELGDRAQQPVEAGFVRADADEDHAPAEKTLPAKRARGQRSASSGHCT